MKASSFPYPEEEQALAANQIRIELRVFYNKLYYMKRPFVSTEDLFRHLCELSQKNIQRYLCSIYGKGNFYQHDIAAKMIEESHFSNSTKTHMRNFIKKVSKTSLHQAILFYKDVPDFPDISFLMSRFNALELSPITLKNKSHYEMLYHPIHYIETRNVNSSPFLS